MPHFSYKARDSGGNLIQGVLDGATAAAVADQLVGSGATPLEIAATTAPTEVGNSAFSSWLKGEQIVHTDLLLFSRQLHALLKAGVPITRALSGLQESAAKAMSNVVRRIRESLESGHELSTSLARQRGIFSPFYVAMVRVGELTGRLDEVFLRLFYHLEFEKLMRDQVRAALRYPTFVVVVMAVAIIVINLFVIPAFAKVYAGLRRSAAVYYPDTDRLL